MQHLTRRDHLAVLAATLLAAPAWAQDFSVRPITMVVPYTAGGPTDAMARMLATAIKPALGQAMIVENRAGAGANIGAEFVARAQPDGYTLMFGTSAPLAINQYLYPALKYDPLKSFAPVIQLGYLPNVLLVHPSVPAKTVQELITYAKGNPGKISFASSGSGASSHLTGMLFNMRTGTDLLHVPYKGTGPALNDLLGGQVQVAFTDVLTAQPFVQTDKLRALGVTSLKRSRAMPDVPTLDEQGIKGFDASVFFGVVAPAGTPQPVAARLNEAFIKVLADPDIKSRLQKQGLEVPTQYTPDALLAYMQAEAAKWREVIDVSGAKVD